MATKQSKTTEAQNTVAQTFTPKIKRVLTLAVLALSIDTPVYIKIEQGFYEGTPTGKAPDAEAQEAGIEQPRLVRVIDLTTGEQMHLVMGHKLHEILESHFPGDDYVHRGFAVKRMRVKRGRGTAQNSYSVIELDLS